MFVLDAMHCSVLSCEIGHLPLLLAPHICQTAWPQTLHCVHAGLATLSGLTTLQGLDISQSEVSIEGLHCLQHLTELQFLAASCCENAALGSLLEQHSGLTHLAIRSPPSWYDMALINDRSITCADHKWHLLHILNDLQ